MIQLMFTTIQKFGVGKMFDVFETSLSETKAVFIWYTNTVYCKLK